MKHTMAIRNLIKLAKERGEKKAEYYHNALDAKVLDEIEALTPVLEKEGFRVITVVNEDWMDTPSDFPEEIKNEADFNKIRCRLDIEWD